MANRPGMKEAMWMAAGAAIVVAALAVVTLIRDARTPLERLAAKSRRADAVSRMVAGLATASDAEKSALFAVTEDDALRHVDDARAAMDHVERARLDLAELLAKDAPEAQRGAFDKFTESFAELKRVDAGLLDLAAKGTNTMATALANGPAAEAVREMGTALDRVVAANPGAEGARAAALASGAHVAALRLQAVFPRHIAESSEREMDELEAVMAVEDEKLKKDLLELGRLTKRGDVSDAGTAWSWYVRLGEARAKIVALSRENTNARALAISANQREKALVACRAQLTTLRNEIDDEPIPGLTHEPLAKPR